MANRCTYKYLIGGKKGTECGRLLRVKGHTHCFQHRTKPIDIKPVEEAPTPDLNQTPRLKLVKKKVDPNEIKEPEPKRPEPKEVVPVPEPSLKESQTFKKAKVIQLEIESESTNSSDFTVSDSSDITDSSDFSISD